MKNIDRSEILNIIRLRRGEIIMEKRIDRIEKAIEELAESRKNDRAIIERLDKSIERHDKILANLEANQIVIGKAMEGIHEEVQGIKSEVSKLVNIVGDFIDAVGYKFKNHETRIKKLEEK